MARDIQLPVPPTPPSSSQLSSLSRFISPATSVSKSSALKSRIPVSSRKVLGETNDNVEKSHRAPPSAARNALKKKTGSPKAGNDGLTRQQQAISSYSEPTVTMHIGDYSLLMDAQPPELDFDSDVEEELPDTSRLREPINPDVSVFIRICNS
jgi:hypothetical protein